MGYNTKIEWCDHTFNPWIGCAKISAGCQHCYAAALNQRFKWVPSWGEKSSRHRTNAAHWNAPRRWNAAAAETETRPRVFCASLADWLDPDVPLDWFADLLILIDQTPHLDWLLLTKRPENWEDAMTAILDTWVPRAGARIADIAADWKKGGFPPNVWIGASAEHQICLDSRFGDLYAIPAEKRFLSLEPLLAPIQLPTRPRLRCAVDWVIVGGESGPSARPMAPEWVIDIRDQCAAAAVPFFFKQWGGKNKALAGRVLQGQIYDAIPVP